MRKAIFLLVAAVACAKTDTPATDTAAAALTPAAPAALTAADLAGTWTGMSMAEGSDSVTNRWTVVRTSDSTSSIVMEGSPDSIAMTVRYEADSMIATSAPFTDPSLPKGAPQITFRSVGRLKDGKLVGTSTAMLASQPDSVVERTRFEATRTP